MASQQQQSSAHKESGCRRTVGAAPDEAQQNNGSRPSEIDSREEESFQQVGSTSKAILEKILCQCICTGSSLQTG